MPDNVYKVIELIGTSEESWEKAAKAAVERAAQSLRDLRVAEVVEQDLVIEKGKVVAYRTKVKDARFGTISHIAGPLMASRLLLPTPRSINTANGSLAEFD
jgi:dodecin